MKVTTKSDVDILEVVGAYTQLTPAGHGEYRGRCPLPEHNDSTPSFFVNAEKGVWLCRGCDMGGDVFDLVSDIEDTDFLGAMKHLSEKHGYDFSLFRKQGKSDARDSSLQFALLEEAARIMWQFLLHGDMMENIHEDEDAKARAYLEARHFQLGEINAWKIGFCPSNPYALIDALIKQGFDPKDIFKCGLAKKAANSTRGGYRDFFSARITIPICDSLGRVIGFTARDLYDHSKAKYLNSPDGEYFQKERALLGLHKLSRKDATAVIVEGALDVIRMHQHGIPAVASLGTALRSTHVDLLLRKKVQKITLLFDGDAAGVKATLKAGKLLLAYEPSLYLARIPWGVDPGDAVGADGRKLLTTAIADAKSLIEYYVEEVGPADFQERHQVLKELMEIIQGITGITDIKKKLLIKEMMVVLGLEDIELPEVGVQSVTSKLKKPEAELTGIEQDILWAIANHHEHPAVAEIIWHVNSLEIGFHVSKKARSFIRQIGDRIGEESLEPLNEELLEIINRRVENPEFERLLSRVVKWGTLSTVERDITLKKQSQEEGLLDYAQARREQLRRRTSR